MKGQWKLVALRPERRGGGGEFIGERSQQSHLCFDWTYLDGFFTSALQFGVEKGAHAACISPSGVRRDESIESVYRHRC